MIPSWHAYLGLIGAALTLVGTLQVAGIERIGLAGLAGFIVWLVWIVSFGIRLIASSSRSESALAEATA